MSTLFATIDWLRRYLVVLLLLFAMGKICVSSIVGQPEPRPQHPPEDFEVSRTMTRLEWQSCPDVSAYEVDVAMDRPDFRDAETRRISNRNYFTLHGLRPGHRYYWRVRSSDSTSRVLTFRVAENALKF